MGYKKLQCKTNTKTKQNGDNLGLKNSPIAQLVRATDS